MGTVLRRIKMSVLAGMKTNAARDVIDVDGSFLTIEDVTRVISDPTTTIGLTSNALKKMRAHRDFLLASAKKQAIYGVNTGFGPMVTHIIGANDTSELQYNLLRGHAMGVGEPINARFVLSAMTIRLNTLAKGNSATSPELVQVLAQCINHRITAIVPEHGAVGTSGDLVQLAHIALPLIGEGEVMYRGKRQQASAALADAGIQPHTLGPKEGLSLINGTSVMTGIGAVLIPEASRALSLAARTGALAFELVHGFTDVISPTLHSLRPHKAQSRIARALRDLTNTSRLLSQRETSAQKVQIGDKTHVTDILLQEVYSLRCIPQILGPILDTLQHTKNTIAIEINSVTDNPVVDLPGKRFLHGGNFHGDYVAVALDQLKAALVKMTMLSERRTNFFLNKNINRTLSPFLNLKTPGLTMGLQGLQFVATSTTAQSQSLGFPHSLHSISTNGDNQDIVSMGTDAALLTAKVLDNAYIVLAIELVALSQAAALLGVERALSRPAQQLIDEVRAQVPLVVEDRSLTIELESFIKKLRYDPSFDIIW
ncbi:aromatic amino acid lyase [Candidatus Kaiserbacteria bacterium]|nr:aromatic amino acid lyase [Candidatus Kaiserbacteria bacterium]